MVDVGATTLDACLFLLSEIEGELRYAFLDTDVRIDLGAFRLHLARRKAIDPSSHGLGLPSPLHPVPASANEYPGSNDHALKVDERFKDATRDMVRQVSA